MSMEIPVVLISMLLFFVLFFGIGFLLNMLLRMSWIMAIVYPIVCIWIIGNEQNGLFDYIFSPIVSFRFLGEKVTSLGAADILILSTGFLGAIFSGIVIRMLRKRGYQMF